MLFMKKFCKYQKKKKKKRERENSACQTVKIHTWKNNRLQPIEEHFKCNALEISKSRINTMKQNKKQKT